MDSLQENLAAYREGAAGTANPKPKQANKSHDQMHVRYKVLRDSQEGREAIMSLLSDDDAHVRCWAAAHSLEWAPELARRVLESVRDSEGPCSFDAKMTLQEFDKGRLSFDY